MVSATDFLPSVIRLFMNLVTTLSPYLASGRTSRFSAAWRRDIYRNLSRNGGAAGRGGADHFGRLAPYFDRRCLRFLTPWVSSTPRRMW